MDHFPPQLEPLAFPINKLKHVDLTQLPQNEYGLQLVQVGDEIQSPALRKWVAGDGQTDVESVTVRESIEGGAARAMGNTTPQPLGRAANGDDNP